MLTKNKKALAPQTLILLVVLIAFLALLLSSDAIEQFNTKKEGTAGYKIFEVAKSVGLFVEKSSQNQLYARGNTDKLLKVPPDVNPNPLYGYPFDQNFCVNSDFGPRNLPPEYYHYGLDLDCIGGEDVKSISGGKVVAVATGGVPRNVRSLQIYPSGYDIGIVANALGNQVHIYDKDMGYVIIYGHLLSDDPARGEEQLENIKSRLNTDINPGEVIGRCGNTGNVVAGTGGGHHLHLQLHAIRENGNEDINTEAHEINGRVYDVTKQVPIKGGPVNPAVLMLPQLKCCQNLAGGDDACDPRIVDNEVFRVG